jgi:hypothetical protein
VGSAINILQDQGGALQLVSSWQRKLTLGEHGKTYYAYDLEALVMCEAAKYRRYYREGCPKFLIVSYHDTIRHQLKQPFDMITKWQARYMRYLFQPFVGAMTLPYRKGALNEVDPLCWRPDFV